jgi:hypothetical protein
MSIRHQRTAGSTSSDRRRKAQQVVAPFGEGATRHRRCRPEPDRHRSLHRRRRHHTTEYGVVAALVGEVLTGERPLEDVEPFVEAGTTGAQLHAGGVELVGPVPHADPELEPRHAPAQRSLRTRRAPAGGRADRCPWCTSRSGPPPAGGPGDHGPGGPGRSNGGAPTASASPSSRRPAPANPCFRQAS